MRNKILRFSLILFKLISSVLVGFFFSILGKVLIGYSHFSFMFIFLTVFFAFFNLIARLQFLGIFLVDILFIVIIGMAHLYIMTAYNS